MSILIYKQISERHVNVEITHLCWNSKYDLLAFGNIRQEIVLQRLFWKKAWEYSCPYENSTIAALCWSPNGVCLLVAYSNFRLNFLDLENGKCLYEMTTSTIDADIFACKWINVDETRKCVEEEEDLLPELPILDKISKNSSFFRRNGQDSLTLLVVAHKNGEMSFYLNGHLHVATIRLADSVSSLDFAFSMDRRRYVVAFFDAEQKKTSVAVYDSTRLIEHFDDYAALASRTGKLVSAAQYLDSTMQRIENSYEDLLIDISEKFEKFAKEKWMHDATATVGDELMTVCAFGSASPELQAFLTNDLTEKNLKKLLATIENNYQNLRRFLKVNLNSALSAIFYHATQLRRLEALLRADCAGSRHESGGSREEVQRSCASASLKTGEMFNVVDLSLKQFSAFFGWLQKIMRSITEENIPPQTTRPSQSIDLNFVVNFIEENFVRVYSESEKPLFRLERVGQYLKNEPLSLEFQRANCFDELTTVEFELRRNASLSQEVLRLKRSLESFFSSLAQKMKPTFVRVDSASFSVQAEICTKVLLKSENGGNFHCFLFGDIFGLKFLKFNAESGKVLSRSDATVNECIVDAESYNAETTTILLKRNSSDSYALAQLKDDFAAVGSSTVDLDHSDKMVSQLVEGGGAFYKLAVCGSRKVGCLLYLCKTRLKLLEMEPDEEANLSNVSQMDSE